MSYWVQVYVGIALLVMVLLYVRVMVVEQRKNPEEKKGEEKNEASFYFGAFLLSAFWPLLVLALLGYVVLGIVAFFMKREEGKGRPQ